MNRYRRLRRHLVVLLTALSLVVVVSSGARADTGTGLASDAGRSWFTDPRAFHADGNVYVGWVTKFGDIQVGSYRLASGGTTIGDLESEFGPDDHDSPAFYETSDGRYTAFYSGHAVPLTHTLYRTTIDPGDISAWTPRDSTDVNTAGSAGATYSNPVPIPGETDRIYLIWRGGDWKPAYAVGTYDPSASDWSWSLRGRLISVPIGRPYVKCAVREDLIGLAFTDGHPYETPSNIYYAAIGKDESGTEAFFRADGSKIKNLAAGPLRPTEADTVFNRLADPDGAGDNAWVWDVAFGLDGEPVVAFVTFPYHAHHQYHWARHEGKAWHDRTIVRHAGGSIADTTIGRPEYYYSGGLALDPLDPSIVYVSRENTAGGWDIEQMKTTSGGGAWTRLPITQGALAANVRPVVPRNRPGHTEMVLWMTGSYDHYENPLTPPQVKEGEWICFRTNVRIWTTPAATSVDEGRPAQALRFLSGAPNPFRESTQIEYALNAETRVGIHVYDIAGRRVRTLTDATKTAGNHRVSWDGRNELGARVASGVYLLRIESGEDALSRRVVLVR